MLNKQGGHGMICIGSSQKRVLCITNNKIER